METVEDLQQIPEDTEVKIVRHSQQLTMPGHKEKKRVLIDGGQLKTKPQFQLNFTEMKRQETEAVSVRELSPFSESFRHTE